MLGIIAHFLIYFKSNIFGDMMESGHCHIYHVVLNQMGPGEDLLRIFNSAMDELVKFGDTDEKNANEQKKAVRKNMQDMC